MSRRLEVETPGGLGAWLVDEAQDGGVLLLLGHGAGGSQDSIDLLACAEHLPAEGVTVARFQQPWRVVGKKVAGPPATLDGAWTAAVPQLLHDLAWQGPLVVGGHSAGARVACRTAGQLGALGVVCLSFPLHPPGKPERSRVDELLLPRLPVLVVQGSKDPFGSGAEVLDAVSGQDTVSGQGRGRIRIKDVQGAAHALSVPARVRPQEEHRLLLSELVLRWIGDVSQAGVAVEE